MSTMERLAAWYASKCDGDWEHSYGITIDTLDNPGWTLTVDLADTFLEGVAFEAQDLTRTDHDWIHLSVRDGKFKMACGPSNLEEGIRGFLDWAEATEKRLGAG